MADDDKPTGPTSAASAAAASAAPTPAATPIPTAMPGAPTPVPGLPGDGQADGLDLAGETADEKTPWVIIVAVASIVLALGFGAFLWLDDDEDAEDDAAIENPSEEGAAPGDAGSDAIGQRPAGEAPGAALVAGGMAPAIAARRAPEPASVEARLRPLVQAWGRAEAKTAAEAAARANEPPKRFPADKDGIQGAMRAAIPEVQECYDAWLGLNPTLGGRLVTKFAIQADGGAGKVINARLDSAGLGNTFLDGCVLSVLSSLPFDVPPADAPNGIVEVTYPLVFTNGGDGGADSGGKPAP